MNAGADRPRTHAGALHSTSFEEAPVQYECQRNEARTEILKLVN